MPFISTIRNSSNRTQPPETVKESMFEGVGGDTVYTAGGYRIHMFTTVGESQFQVKLKDKFKDVANLVNAGAGVTVEYLVIGGGGSGGMGLSTNGNGGGGAGGYVTGSTPKGLPSSTPVTVGSGGPPQPYNGAANGTPSDFGPIQALYGGRGGYYYGSAGQPGGSGGGAAYGYSAGSGSQGYPGSPYTYTWSGGGGGGSSEAAPNHQGGLGTASSITGTSIARAGGGGGGGNSSEPGGNGASGGGRGHGSTPNWGYSYYSYSQDPRGGWGVTHAYTANSGSGGGAGSYWAPSISWPAGAGYGATGVVIVRYPS